MTIVQASGGGAEGNGGGVNDRFVRVASVVLLALIAVRACVGQDSFPFWSGDPTVFAAPSIALRPGAAMGGDIGIGMIGLLLFAARRRGQRVDLAVLGAAAAFAAGCFVHAWSGGRLRVEHAMVGVAWAGAAFGAIGLWTACRDVSNRRIAIGVLCGVCGIVAAKGVLQVFVEHPQTLASFRETREVFFASQGWSSDSVMARTFERRLMQAEATGWFGLANPVSSYAAAWVTALVAMLVFARPSAAMARLGVALGAVAAGTLVVLCGSMGGYAAAGVGMGLVVLAVVSDRVPAVRRWGWLAGPVLMAGVLGVVVVRGLVGERIGELSLLFRAFYLEAAWRIFAEHPLLGVGPAGFKDAYVLAKPALSPEEVSSPHSVFADWLSMLGLLGLGWCVVTVFWSVRASRAALGSAVEGGSVGSGDVAADAKLTALALAAPVLVGAMIEAPGATPASAVFRVAGLLLGVAIGSSVVVAGGGGGRGVARAAALAALVLLAHAQIEVTGTIASGAAMFAAMIAVGASVGGGGAVMARRADVAAVGAAILFGAVSLWTFGVMNRWDGGLEAAARGVGQLSMLRARLEDAVRREGLEPTASRREIAAVARELSELRVERASNEAEALRAAIASAMADRMRMAEGDLESAASGVMHFGTAQALSRLRMQLAELEERSGASGRAGAFRGRALEGAARAAEESGTSSAYGWLGTLRLGAAAGRPEAEARAMTEGAVEAWARAAELDPYNLVYAVQIARAERVSAGVRREWAGRAIRLDEGLRLDPLKRLSAEERAKLEGIASGKD
jgi:hypothetical protein